MSGRIALKHLSSAPVVNGLGLSGEHANPDWPRYIRTTDIASPRALRADTFASQPPEIAAKAPVQCGDILMTAAGATIGKSVLIDDDVQACFAGFLVRFRPGPHVDGRFIAYWMQSVDYWSQIDMGAVRSTIDNFSARKYQNLQVPEVGLEEQRKIADFLDDQVSRVEGLLAARNRQKELIWSDAYSWVYGRVLADGGVMTRLRRMIESETLGTWGVDPSEAEPTFVARVADFNRETFKLGPVATLRGVDERTRVAKVLNIGDTLLERSGGTQKNPVGCAVYVTDATGPMVCSNFVSRVRPVEGVHPRYLSLVLAALYSNGEQRPHSNQTTGIQNLDTESYFDVQVPVLSGKAQQDAAGNCDSALDSAEGSAAALTRTLALLDEYKRSLITAAVTGDLDVTTARPGVPA